MKHIYLGLFVIKNTKLNQKFLQTFICLPPGTWQVHHLVSLNAAADGDKDAGGETDVADALQDGVEKEWVLRQQVGRGDGEAAEQEHQVRHTEAHQQSANTHKK